VFVRLLVKISDRILGQQISIKFCVKLGKNASDTCAVLSEACYEKVKCFEWYNRFKEGCENVDDGERIGRP